MNPVIWIALAYGVVAATLLTYTIRLKRRVRRAEMNRPEDGTPRMTQPFPIP